MIAYLCGRYFLYLLATYVLLFVIGMVLLQFDITMPSGFGTVVSAMIPALWVGNTYYKSYKTLPESSFSWKISFYFTLLHLAFGAVLFAIFVSVIPELQSLSSIGFVFIAGVFVFLGLIMFFTTRYFFGLGAKSAARVA